MQPQFSVCRAQFAADHIDEHFSGLLLRGGLGDLLPVARVHLLRHQFERSDENVVQGRVVVGDRPERDAGPRCDRAAWTRFVPFLAFPPMLRRVIYTTNAIESLNYQLRKVTKNPDRINPYL